MTPAQINHYRALWADVRRVLREQGLNSKACEERRHTIHRETLGRDVSSMALTNRQFDKVKGAFLAISQPTNLNAQVHALNGDAVRGRHVVATLCAKIGYDDDNLQGLIDRMQREGRLREPERPRAFDSHQSPTRGSETVSEWDIERERDPVRRLTLTDLRPEELERVIIALRLQGDRQDEQHAAELAAPTFNF